MTSPATARRLWALGEPYHALLYFADESRAAGAWTADETVNFMFDRIEAGDFYILCPDNEAPRQLDEKRIAWAAGDIIENRPPLSRWHPDWAEEFKKTVS